MKSSYLKLLALFFFLILSIFSKAQYHSTFSVEMSKSEFEYGDTIKFNYIIQNSTNIPDTLRFAHSCITDYYIDDFCSCEVYGCLTVPTTFIIPADTTIIFENTHENEYYLPEPGVHKLIAVLKNYDRDSTEFTIYTPTKIEKENSNVLSNFNLSQNYPNPFNPTTKFSFTIFETSKVNLTVYDILGNEILVILNDTLNEGRHIIEFTAASDLPSGIYFYRLQSGNHSKTQKMLLLK